MTRAHRFAAAALATAVFASLAQPVFAIAPGGCVRFDPELSQLEWPEGLLPLQPESLRAEAVQPEAIQPEAVPLLEVPADFPVPEVPSVTPRVTIAPAEPVVVPPMPGQVVPELPFQAVVVIPVGGQITLEARSHTAWQHQARLRDEDGHIVAWFRNFGISGSWTSPVNTTGAPIALQLEAEFRPDASQDWLPSQLLIDGAFLRFEDGADDNYTDLILHLETDQAVWELTSVEQLMQAEDPHEVVIVDIARLLEVAMLRRGPKGFAPDPLGSG